MIKIRRYYGYDADSFNGFNNGHYIDAEPIEAIDESHAMLLCREALAERWDLSRFTTEDLEVDDASYILTVSYNDGRGKELTRDEFRNLDDDASSNAGYRYVFVNYEVSNE